MTGTSREGYGSLRAVVELDGKGAALEGVQIQVGYIIGCFADLNSVTTGLQAGMGPQDQHRTRIPDSGGAARGAERDGDAEHPSIHLPGQINAYPLAQKNLEATQGVIQLREAHMNIDGCLAPAQVRAYSSVVIDSKVVKDGSAVYGDTFPI